MQQRHDASFDGALHAAALGPVTKDSVTTLQINMGRRCNQSCNHCHVGAGPDREEMMADDVTRGVVALLERSPGVRVVDVTGGPGSPGWWSAPGTWARR